MRTATAIGCLCLLGTAAGAGDPTKAEIEVFYKEFFLKATPARQLASYEAARFVPEDHPSVAEFRALLNKVRALYSEDEQRIVNISMLFFDEIRTAKKNVSLKEMLQGSLEWQNPLYFKRGRAREYAEYGAVYASMRIDYSGGEPGKKGVDHKQAIRDMRIVAEALTLPEERTAVGTPVLSNKRAETILGMARNLDKSGKPAAALKYYRQVVKEYPGTAQAKEAAARIKASAK